MTTFRRRSRLRALSFFALAIAPPVLCGTAQAQTPADLESARVLYKEGKECREKGDFKCALQKFKAAYTLATTPITAFELGQTYVRLGRLTEGREVLIGVARLPIKQDESAKSAEAREEAKRLADETKARLATLVLKLRASEPPPTVTLDAEQLPREALDVPRILDPGKHSLVATASGRTKHIELDMHEGETRELELSVSELDSPAPGVESPAPHGGSHVLTVAGLVTAATGITVGAITGAFTLSDASTLKTDCAAGQCLPPSHDLLTSAKTLGTVSTIGFGVGVAGLAMTAIGLLTSHGDSPSKKPPAAAWASPCAQGLGAGVCGGFR
jgi:hypothetical protein